MFSSCVPRTGWSYVTSFLVHLLCCFLSLEYCCHSLNNIFSCLLIEKCFIFLDKEWRHWRPWSLLLVYNLNFASCVLTCIITICVIIIITILFFTDHKISNLLRFALPTFIVNFFITFFIILLSEKKSRPYSLLGGYFWGVLFGAIFTVNQSNHFLMFAKKMCFWFTFKNAPRFINCCKFSLFDVFSHFKNNV